MDLTESRTSTSVTNASLHLHDTDRVEKTEYKGAYWVETTSADGKATLGTFVHPRNLDKVREFAAALLQTCYEVEKQG